MTHTKTDRIKEGIEHDYCSKPPQGFFFENADVNRNTRILMYHEVRIRPGSHDQIELGYEWNDLVGACQKWIPMSKCVHDTDPVALNAALEKLIRQHAIEGNPIDSDEDVEDFINQALDGRCIEINVLKYLFKKTVEHEEKLNDLFTQNKLLAKHTDEGLENIIPKERYHLIHDEFCKIFGLNGKKDRS